MRLILAIAALAATALAAPQYGSLPTVTVSVSGPSTPTDITLTNGKGQPVGTIGFGNGGDIPTTVIITSDGSNTVNDGYGNPDPNVAVISGNGGTTTVKVN
jgi:hypothetical protein